MEAVLGLFMLSCTLYVVFLGAQRSLRRVRQHDALAKAMGVLLFIGGIVVWLLGMGLVVALLGVFVDFWRGLFR